MAAAPKRRDNAAHITWLGREWGEHDRDAIAALDELRNLVVRAGVPATLAFLSRRALPKAVTVRQLAARVGASDADRDRYERASTYLRSVHRHGPHPLCGVCGKPVLNRRDKTCSPRCGRLARIKLDRSNPLSVWLVERICREPVDDGPLGAFADRAGIDRQTVRDLVNGKTQYPRHAVLVALSRATRTPLREIKAMLPSGMTHEEYTSRKMSALAGTPEKKAMSAKISATRRELFKDPEFKKRQAELVGRNPNRRVAFSAALRRHWADPKRRRVHILKLLVTTDAMEYRVARAVGRAAEGTGTTTKGDRTLSTSQVAAVVTQQSAKFDKPPEEIQPIVKRGVRRLKIKLVGGRTPDCARFRLCANRMAEGKTLSEIAHEMDADAHSLNTFFYEHRRLHQRCREYEASLKKRTLSR